MESFANPQQLCKKEFKYKIIIVANYKELRLLAKRIDIHYDFLQTKFLPNIASDTNSFEIYIADPDQHEHRIISKLPLAHAFVFLNNSENLRQTYKLWQSDTCLELFFDIHDEKSSMASLVKTLDIVADANQTKSKIDLNFRLKIFFILQEADKGSLFLLLDRDILRLITLTYSNVAKERNRLFFPAEEITSANNSLADDDVEKSRDCCHCTLI